jgi:hypothetical protein
MSEFTAGFIVAVVVVVFAYWLFCAFRNNRKEWLYDIRRLARDEIRDHWNSRDPWIRSEIEALEDRLEALEKKRKSQERPEEK